MLNELFNAQVARSLELRKTSAQIRTKKLKALKQAIQEREPAIFEALAKDLRKSSFEAAVTEIHFVYGEIDHAVGSLKQWMRPKRAGKTATTFFARSRIHYEPKGVCLILSPWNYPFQLVLSPLVSAIAAGNCVVLKPSEISAHTTGVVKQIIESVFENNEVACLEGDKELASKLLQLPFDHIFFTGSTEVGKTIMAAAAKNLTSCTLELGGKSPVVVSECNIDLAAEKIVWGKLVNAGQTCIAPDYALVRKDLIPAFLNAAKHALTRLYYKDGEINLEAYGKVINDTHFERIKNLVDEAIANGATLHSGGKMDISTRTIEPVLITGVPAGNTLLKDEIFGPVLPIISYVDFKEALAYINARPKPLAAYLFSAQNEEIKSFLTETSAGGSCINDVLVHIATPKLPFGGVGHSGTGSSHGYFGFKAFSHERAILYQSSFNLNKLAYPPYDKKTWVQRLLKKI